MKKDVMEKFSIAVKPRLLIPGRVKRLADEGVLASVDIENEYGQQ